MNLDQIEGNLQRLGDQAKEQWNKLTDDDTGRAGSYAGQLSGLVKKAYDATRDEADRQTADWRPTALERAAARAAKKAARVRDDAGDWLRDTADAAGSRTDRWTDKAARKAAESADRMAQNPGRGAFKTALLMASIGALVGLYFYGDRDTDQRP